MIMVVECLPPLSVDVSGQSRCFGTHQLFFYQIWMDRMGVRKGITRSERMGNLILIADVSSTILENSL